MKKTLKRIATIITILTIFSTPLYAFETMQYDRTINPLPAVTSNYANYYVPSDYRSWYGLQNLPDFKIIGVWIRKRNCTYASFQLDVQVNVENAGGDAGLNPDSRLKVSMRMTNDIPELDQTVYITAPGPGESRWVDISPGILPNIMNYMLQTGELEFVLDENDLIEERDESNNDELVFVPDEWLVSNACPY